jgi:hypothetical protein
MKRKSNREIPDFSRQPTRGKGGGAAPAGKADAAGKPDASGVRNAPRPAAKPQATSSKSGRRGQ